MVLEAARGSVRIDAHAPPTTRPMHRSSDLPAMRFATSLCRGAERSRPRAPRLGCGIALPCGIPIGPGSALYFVVKQTGGREPVQGSSKGTSLSGRELVWRVCVPVNAGLGTVSPQTPKPPGRDRASYGGAYEQIPRRADPELRPSALGKSGAAGGQGRRVLASGRD